jgi:hypothetical protein
MRDLFDGAYVTPGIARQPEAVWLIVPGLALLIPFPGFDLGKVGIDPEQLALRTLNGLYRRRRVGQS